MLQRIIILASAVLAVGCSGIASEPAAAGPAQPVATATAHANGAARERSFDRLEQDIRARIADAGEMEVAVAMIDLASGQRLGIDEDLSMHAASTMKVPVLLELFRQADRGGFSADDSIPIINEFSSIADGSRYTLATDRDRELIERLGQPISLRRLAHGMITISSNLATNILIDHLGAENIQRTMASVDASEMVVLRGVSDTPAFRAGMNNTTTAAALARVMEVIARCEMNSTESCDAMLEILEEQRFRSEIPAGVPEGVRVANKTGSITGIRHDAAIVMPPGREPYVLVVLTRGASSPGEATQVAVDVSRRVWEELGAVPER